jgi:hypothetical protein
MKVLLMHAERDFDPQQPPPANERALIEDLGLDALLGTMAGEDEFLLGVARRALLPGERNDRDTVLYRQRVLADCLKNPEVVRALYDLAVEAIESRRKHYYGFLSQYPGAILSGSVGLLEMLLEMLQKLRDIAQENAGRFESQGFVVLFAMLQRELAHEYLAGVSEHLRELKFRHGVLVSAGLGTGGGASVGHVLRKPHERRGNWLQRLLRKDPPALRFRLHERDEAGARILSDLRDRGINLVANALGQSAEHVLNFFVALRTELAFYLGCMSLHARLSELKLALCFPEPLPAGARALRFDELRDPGIALHSGRLPVGNTVDADGRSLAIVTGPNQGGKSSFLRSLGVAQLMMECGMFVAAQSYHGELSMGLFTHYKREEDASMKSGKFDEEMARMSEIVDRLGPNALMLFNESFAATNEREGSEIARQIVDALLEKRIKVLFVTHQYDFAHGCFERNAGEAIFLRAERKPDGSRSFKVVEGEPLETSYGEDVYRDVFGESADAVVSRPALAAYS